jgi:erythromycin esterase
VDPSGTAFADLEPLARAIGDARIVMLGESSHGDGTTNLAKTRLVKFLHERMGFDVLVWESGVYDVDRAWRLIREGESARTAAPKGVYRVWATLNEVQPLFTYIEHEARGTRPLEIDGADIKFSALASREAFVEDLRRALRGFRIPTSSLDPGSVLQAGFDSMAALVAGRLSPPGFVDSLAALRRTLATSMREAPTLEKAFWARILSGLSETAISWRIEQDFRRTPPDTAEGIRFRNMRDVEMGRNLIWLAREKYPTKKLIVWGATAHLNYGGGGGDGIGLLTMGALARDAFGPAIYQVAFSSFNGTGFSPQLDTRPYQVTQTPTGDGLEELMAEAGFHLAFLDLRNRPAGGEWLSGMTWARPMGNYPDRRRWPEKVDAFFFIRTMQPATRVVP